MPAEAENLIKKMQNRQREREIDADDEIELEEPADDELDAEDEPDEPAKPSRQERRRERGNQRMSNLEQELEDERRRRRELEEVAHQRSLQMLQGPPQQQQDPLEAQLDRLQEEELRLNKEYALARQSGLTDAQEQEYIKRARDVRNGIQQTNARIARRGEPDPHQVAQYSAEQARVQSFMAKHRDVNEHPDRLNVGGRIYSRASIWADNRYRQLLAEGKPEGEATAEIAIEEARQKFVKGDHRAPSRDDRGRFAGAPRSSNGASNGGPTRVTMTEARKSMAEGLYPELARKDPKLAWQKWANTVGRRRA